MLSSLTTFGQTSTGIGALGFDGKAFLIQLLTFLLALWVLKRYAFKPILKVLDDRRETIERGVKLGEQMEKAKAELEAKIDKVLRDSRTQADEIISNAEATARAAIREAEEAAKQKAENILKAGETQLVQEAAKMRQSIEKEVVELVAETTGAIIREKIDTKKDGELIKQALKEQQA
jgi:F-type H+-transporting ATPase subunit b